MSEAFYIYFTIITICSEKPALEQSSRPGLVPLGCRRSILDGGLKEAWEEVLQEEDGCHQQEATQEEQQPHGEVSCRAHRGQGTDITLMMMIDEGLTSLSDAVHLAAAVHPHTQQGCLAAPLHGARQEGQVCDHDAVGLLSVVQPLHKHPLMSSQCGWLHV